MNKTGCFVAVLLLVLVSGMLPGARALGIRPAKSTIEYRPGVQNFSFHIVNNEGKELYLMLTPEGDVSNYITVSHPRILFLENQSEVKVPFSVDFPEDMLPVEGRTAIMVEEVGAGQPGVSSKFRIGHEIILQYMYEGKYISVAVYFEEMEDEINMVASVENQGTEDIQAVQAFFDVYGDQGRVAHLKTQNETLYVDEKRELNTSLEKRVIETGGYEVLASVQYDGERMDLSKELSVGEPGVIITGHDTHLKAGEINPFEVRLRSDWNRPLSSVRMTVSAPEAGIEAEFPTFTIEPGKENTIVGYVDATTVEVGEYPANITVLYSGTSDTTPLTLTILTQEEYEKQLQALDFQKWVMISVILVAVLLFVAYKLNLVRI